MIIAGHSFVKNLVWFVARNKIKNMGLKDADVVLSSLKEDGSKIIYAQDLDTWVDQYAVVLKVTDVLILDCGSNDITVEGPYYNHPEGLADKMLDIAVKCKNLGVKRIIIHHLMFRKGKGAIHRAIKHSTRLQRYLAQEDYNDRATRFNREMQRLCDLGDGRISLMRPKGLKEKWISKLRRSDGVHLGKKAEWIYYRNLRALLIANGLKSH